MKILFFNRYSYFIVPYNLHSLNTNHNLNIIPLHNFLIHDFIYFLPTELVLNHFIRFTSITDELVSFVANFLNDYSNDWTRIYIDINFVNYAKQQMNRVLIKFHIIYLRLVD